MVDNKTEKRNSGEEIETISFLKEGNTTPTMERKILNEETEIKNLINNKTKKIEKSKKKEINSSKKNKKSLIEKIFESFKDEAIIFYFLFLIYLIFYFYFFQSKIEKRRYTVSKRNVEKKENDYLFLNLEDIFSKYEINLKEITSSLLSTAYEENLINKTMVKKLIYF